MAYLIKMTNVHSRLARQNSMAAPTAMAMAYLTRMMHARIRQVQPSSMAALILMAMAYLTRKTSVLHEAGPASNNGCPVPPPPPVETIPLYHTYPVRM
jgi:hypothetical protein